MTAEIDLTTASREDLIALIASLRATIAALQRRVEELEAQVSGGGRPRGMPGNEMAPGRAARGGGKSRKRSLEGFGRRRMEPTERVVHALDSCPGCGTGLSGGWEHRSRGVIDIPEVPVSVTGHVMIARSCPTCRRRRMPSPDLGGVAIGRQRLGIRLMRWDCGAARGGQADGRQDPVVPADRARPRAERGGDSRCDPPRGRDV